MNSGIATLNRECNYSRKQLVLIIRETTKKAPSESRRRGVYHTVYGLADTMAEKLPYTFADPINR